MKITFLGTAAAEGIPSPYCDCPTCQHARTYQGKNIRKRSSVLINHDMLIDMGPDLVTSCANLGISLNGLQYVLITHSHFDHFYPHNLEIRGSRYMENEPSPITFAAGPSALMLLDQIGYRDKEMILKRLPILPSYCLSLEHYQVSAIAATHAPLLGDAMNYIIDDGEVKILYATDTGIYSERVLRQLESHTFHLVIIDVTNGQGKTSPNHLNSESLKMMIDLLIKANSVNENTLLYATHFSHISNPYHDKLEKMLKERNILCAYDGLVVNV